MKGIPLHIRTAAFASLISLVALVLSLLIFSFSVAERFQQEQKQLATLQAENLAERLSSNRGLIESESLQELIEIASRSGTAMTIRIWRVSSDSITGVTSSKEEGSVSDEQIKDILGKIQKNTRSIPVESFSDEGRPVFQVFAPVFHHNKLVSVVEVVEKLDTISSITFGYLPSLSWIVLVVFLMMGLVFYLFFQRSIYKPLEGLLNIYDGGDEKQVFGNEFRILSDKFASMVSQIKQMSQEREKQNEILQQKISEATAELKKKNEQLESANLELFMVYRKMREMERLAAAGQITAELAHEVATPLNLISGHAQLLKNSLPSNSKQAERLDLIIGQIERIERVVREALIRTRLGTRLDINYQKEIDLNSLLKQIFQIVDPILQENKIEVEFSLEENLPNITGDADRLQQVFLNLVSNSLDAMPEGGLIKIATSSSHNEVIVDFADTGCGFSEEAKANLFQPLFTTKQPGKGTGLGLFLVREILQEHNAEITLESQQDQSAHFRIRFKI
ncbi:MAG: ATP-binding protein [Pyrinomonadaceae bacterium]|nr:ATP-binding protein [Pyrinomonadaceae bacterium]MCX7640718.1 ATP-binding protein [Pyrinomonadaceae bacterium]MDW8305314.1 ATP-binding protein [Acidobacteriota bacterium]